MIFGIVLALTGVIVILLTFIGNHSAAVQTAAQIQCATPEERSAYLTSLGWEFDSGETEKEITVPSEFNQVYEDYNDIQKKQGFDLEEHKGETATLYTYNITNYKSNENDVADLIVANGVLIGADLCDPSADNGFLTALEEKNGTT